MDEATRLDDEATRLDNRVWGGLALRGLVAILFGALALTRPEATVLALVYLFGAFAFMDGLFALVSSISIAKLQGRWWPMLLLGLVGILIGVLSFVEPAVTAVGWLYYIAIWAVLTGILEVAAAIRLRKVIEGEWMLGVSGVLSIAFGILIGTKPGVGMLSLTWLIGAYAIVLGVLFLGLALRLRGAQKRLATP
jgi:uncharacterized membrane protein HdeD (DUF308 family)